ncbi:hypothetical protein CK203_046311 [Vitis vinifera]|uniref:Retrotransposon gag domain-containing protein n=1 Tax=Vitis vinifera TaxID=29760 RepID=A0A438FW36_VITVI|nr:hypothetical protein CK203_046311 [Vitis vinifera]
MRSCLGPQNTLQNTGLMPPYHWRHTLSLQARLLYRDMPPPTRGAGFPRIIKYEPPRGFIVPKFYMYDGSSDPFDHIMHYRQLMTLDIGNDRLLCKVFPASLQGQALSWFHQLPANSIDNFRDLFEASWGSTYAQPGISKISAPCRTSKCKKMKL